MTTPSKKPNPVTMAISENSKTAAENSKLILAAVSDVDMEMSDMDKTSEIEALTEMMLTMAQSMDGMQTMLMNMSVRLDELDKANRDNSIRIAQAVGGLTTELKAIYAAGSDETLSH